MPKNGTIKKRERRKQMNIKKLQSEIGIHFKQESLLETALTHTSYANEHGVDSNEKLEFLGDAILEFVISSYLFRTYKHLSEGEMTKVRASIVCEESLHQVALKHNFSDFLNLGKSELAMHGAQRPAVLADSVEAVIAAIYIDQGLDIAQKFILDNLKEAAENATKHVGQKDYKTVLQEKLQVDGDVDIKYITVKEEGPDHDKKFTVELSVNGKVITFGEGQSKKAAEMQAAKKALEK